MSRVRSSSIPTKQKQELLDELWSMIALLEDIDQVRAFFKDLLSESEAIMLARRIRIARLLLHGDTYEDIRSSTGAAINTIASVQHWLESENAGYKKSLPSLEKELDRRQQVSSKKHPSKHEQPLEWMKAKYPLHFLLFRALDSIADSTPKRLRAHKKSKS